VPPALGFRYAGEVPAPVLAPAHTGIHCVWRVEAEVWIERDFEHDVPGFRTIRQ
jgi:hypothetical protein